MPSFVLIRSYGSASAHGRSPESDAGASQYSTASWSGRMVRLCPDEELMQPMEPGTPSTESTMATQQLWDALQRSRATAYRVRSSQSHPHDVSSLRPLSMLLT